MEGDGEQTHFVKRLVLPSGRTIEVLYFREMDHSQPVAEAPVDETAGAPKHPPAEPHQDLHVCIECASELVYPVQWEESGPENWGVLLHCPNCDLYREGVFAQDTVDSFEAELDRGAEALALDYEQLLRANLADEIERFVGALNRDALLPEDF